MLSKEYFLRQAKSNHRWGQVNCALVIWNLFAAVCIASTPGFIIFHCLLMGAHVYLANGPFVRARWWKEKADEHK